MTHRALHVSGLLHATVGELLGRRRPLPVRSDPLGHLSILTALILTTFSLTAGLWSHVRSADFKYLQQVNMPRRKKKSAKPKGMTYYKAKNGRFYKKIEIDGKMRVRFVTNQEALGTISAKKTRKKPASKAKQQDQPKQEPTAESVEEKVTEE